MQAHNAALGGTAANLHARSVKLLGFFVINGNGSRVYVQVYDASTAAETGRLSAPIPVPANSSPVIPYTATLGNGLTVKASANADGSGTPAGNVEVLAFLSGEV